MLAAGWSHATVAHALPVVLARLGDEMHGNDAAPDGQVLILTEHSVPRLEGTRAEGWIVLQPPIGKANDYPPVRASDFIKRLLDAITVG